VLLFFRGIAHSQGVCCYYIARSGSSDHVSSADALVAISVSSAFD